MIIRLFRNISQRFTRWQSFRGARPRRPALNFWRALVLSALALPALAHCGLDKQTGFDKPPAWLDLHGTWLGELDFGNGNPRPLYIQFLGSSEFLAFYQEDSQETYFPLQRGRYEYRSAEKEIVFQVDTMETWDGLRVDGLLSQDTDSCGNSLIKSTYTNVSVKEGVLTFDYTLKGGQNCEDQTTTLTMAKISGDLDAEQVFGNASRLEVSGFAAQAASGGQASILALAYGQDGDSGFLGIDVVAVKDDLSYQGEILVPHSRFDNPEAGLDISVIIIFDHDGQWQWTNDGPAGDSYAVYQASADNPCQPSAEYNLAYDEGGQISLNATPESGSFLDCESSGTQIESPPLPYYEDFSGNFEDLTYLADSSSDAEVEGAYTSGGELVLPASFSGVASGSFTVPFRLEGSVRLPDTNVGTSEDPGIVFIGGVRNSSGFTADCPLAQAGFLTANDSGAVASFGSYFVDEFDDGEPDGEDFQATTAPLNTNFSFRLDVYETYQELYIDDFGTPAVTMSHICAAGTEWSFLSLVRDAKDNAYIDYLSLEDLSP